MPKTKGNLDINAVNIGDKIYKVDRYNHIIYRITVLTLPVRTEDGFWQFDGYIESIEKLVTIVVDENNLKFTPELYDYVPYKNFDIV